MFPRILDCNLQNPDVPRIDFRLVALGYLQNALWTYSGRIYEWLTETQVLVHRQIVCCKAYTTSLFVFFVDFVLVGLDRGFCPLIITLVATRTRLKDFQHHFLPHSCDGSDQLIVRKPQDPLRKSVSVSLLIVSVGMTRAAWGGKCGFGTPSNPEK